MRHLMFAAALALSSALVPASANAQDALVQVKADAGDGRIVLTLPRPEMNGIAARYIYIAQVETGLGSAAVIGSVEAAGPAPLLTVSALSSAGSALGQGACAQRPAPP